MLDSESEELVSRFRPFTCQLCGLINLCADKGMIPDLFFSFKSVKYKVMFY